jgi:hypothetical protein
MIRLSQRKTGIVVATVALQENAASVSTSSHVSMGGPSLAETIRHPAPKLTVYYATTELGRFLKEPKGCDARAEDSPGDAQSICL